MNHYKFERAARRRRSKAMMLTILIHLLLLAGIAYSGNVKLSEILPENIQQMIGVETPAEEAEQPKP